jgi:hypothetical protein
LAVWREPTRIAALAKAEGAETIRGAPI